jgi:AcrR family transcriptional regulator
MVMFGYRSNMSPRKMTRAGRRLLPAPLAGRRERRAAETREKLFRCALALFAQRGFANVTVKDITEAADVGKGTFFNYFPTREHVLAAFADLQVSKAAAMAEAACSGRSGAAETLQTFPHVMTEEPGRTPQLITSIIAAFASNDAVRKIFVERQGAARRHLQRIIALAQKRSEVRRDIHSSVLARAFQQVFFGTLLLWSMDPSESLERRVKTAFDVVWHGLGPERATQHKGVK